MTEGGNGMATVGFIGSGHIGGTVARLAADAGYQVVLSNSRGPDTLTELVAALGPAARAGTPAEAAAAGDLVLVSIPLYAYRSVPAQPLAGKVVMDTNNYYPQRDGNIAELDDGSTTGPELLEAHLGTAQVVKVFNNIYFAHLGELARPAGAPDRSALPIAGDSAGAKAAVTAFLDAIGYDTVDAGPLGEGGRLFQVDTPAYGRPYGIPGESAGTPVGVDAIRAALAAA